MSRRRLLILGIVVAVFWSASLFAIASASPVTISSDSGKSTCNITVPSGSTVINRWTVEFPDGTSHTYHDCSSGVTGVAPLLGATAFTLVGLSLMGTRSVYAMRRVD